MLTVPRPLLPQRGQRVLHNPIDHDWIASHLWSNDPADDGNALAGVLYAVLIEAGIVALIVLLYWLF
jgi:hypothetical protein